MKKFRILSIDGGGIRGMLPASFLTNIEESSGKSIYKHFDLITGTSTGSIIALGLALGLPAKDILDFYKKFGPHIFPNHSRIRKAIASCKHLVFNKYSADTLTSAIEAVFKDSKLGESKTRVVVPSITQDGHVYLYKTFHHPRLRSDHLEKASTVALSSSAAPTYFPIHKTPSGVRLLDGGMWANNPLMVGVVEAISLLDIPREEIMALSLGTTSTLPSIGSFAARRGGKFSWIKAIEFFMHGQSVSAENQAKLLIGPENVFRVQRDVPSGLYSLDNFKAAEDLEGIGKELSRKFSPQIMEHFFSDEVEPFVPFT